MENLQILQSFVIVGAYNPRNFDKHFFIKNEVIQENEMNDGTIFDAIGAIQVLSENISIIVTMNQIAVTAFNDENGNARFFKIVQSILDVTDLTSVRAVGSNFHWGCFDSSITLNALSKKLFFNQTNGVLNRFFNQADTLYGYYTSTNYLDSRLKLEIKPQNANPENLNTEHLLYIFNYHHEIKTNERKSDVLKQWQDFDKYFVHSYEVMQSQTIQ